MIQMHSESIAISVDGENGGIVLTDKLRGMEWSFDGIENLRFQSAKARGGAIELIYSAPSGAEVMYRYALHDDFVEIKLIAGHGCGGVTGVKMPSAFSPSGAAKKYLFPIMQGMLWDTSDKTFVAPFETVLPEGAHVGFTMPMFAVLGDTGAMLYISETQDDCHWTISRGADGKTRCDNIQDASAGTLRYDRVGRIYFTDPSITKATKRYRARVVEKGRFVTFREKIERHPDKKALKNMFGSLMCFVGYCQDDIDYVENFKKLKAYGFERALVYPVHFNVPSLDFKMGGVAPINLSDAEIAAIKDLGYDVAPWTYVNQITNPDQRLYALGHDVFSHGLDGNRFTGWQMDDYINWQVCPSFIQDVYVSLRTTTDRMREMTWDHFDTLANNAGFECPSPDHETHMDRPLTRSEYREYQRKLFLYARENTGAVSSESFNDAYSLEYDMGSAKAWAQYDPFMFKPVPLSMLVYHDSIIHSWWEVHNYNSKYHTRDLSPFYQYGGGRYELQATMDALYGLPPDVMPFGAQYGWTNDYGSPTMLYRFRFEDPETQLALKCALPVAKNHEKVGMLEMTDFEFLTKNYHLQKTTFADGTKIYANFGPRAIYHPECGSVDPLSWKYGC